MGIQYQTDEQGNRVAVVIPLAEWEAVQAELYGEARMSSRDEEDRREAYAALTRGEALDIGRAMVEGEDLQRVSPGKEKGAPIEAFGMTPAEGRELRSRLDALAEDWDSPEMDAYDRYDEARQGLETR